MNCRHCATSLSESRDVFADLGTAPPSNAFLRHDDLARGQTHLPLKVYTCPSCWLVQVDEIERFDQLFSSDYVYHSSTSASWLAHARAFVEQAVPALGLGPQSLVMELASNDGYLLQYLTPLGVPCVGIEPTDSTARVARERGIETISEFFGLGFAQRFARDRRQADLIVANNVLAHVPDINDFVAGMAAALAPAGAISIEFPQLLQLVQQNQFDTIYHEHFSYLSLGTVQRILAAQGLVVWDVQSLSTHGGSLRVWAQHAANVRAVDGRAVNPRVEVMLAVERAAGMQQAPFYQGFQPRCEAIKDELLAFLIEQKRAGQRVVGYGAAAKGNTLLNYAGVRADLLPYVVDASPYKQGRWLPGSRIPVVGVDRLWRDRPEVILILPWNLSDEISEQLRPAREWNATFATAIPRLRLW